MRKGALHNRKSLRRLSPPGEGEVERPSRGSNFNLQLWGAERSTPASFRG
jgi:hypothetical protein